MAWTKTTVNKYSKAVTTDDVASAAAPVYSDVFATDPSGGYAWVGMNFSVGSADVVAPLKLQISHNGTTFTDHATLIADTTPNVTGDKMVFYDFSAIASPYYRFSWNDGSLAAGTSGRFKFIVIHKVMQAVHAFVG